MPRSKPGKSLETLVSSIERVLARNDNVTVESPKFLPDRITGESREHDVVITLTGSHHKSTIAIECRDRSRKVTVNEIESFWGKCQDTGIDQGIIVSSKGFTKPALTKSLHRGIRKLADAEFEAGPGTKKIVFISPGLLLRDDSTGNTYVVNRALAAVDYEVTEEFVPFNMVTYENNPSGDLIADAAVARVDLGALKGKFMIVYKQSEGGQVVFVPDKGI